MSQIVSAVAVVAFVTLFRGLIRRCPAAFYALAALVAAIGLFFTYNPSPDGAVRAMAYAIQKGHVGFALLALVMFVGVFGKGSPVRRALAPIRSELSIMGGILMLAHMTPYLANYVSLAGSMLSLRPSVLASLAIAAVLLVLLALLVVTSIKAVCARMDARTWKRIQLLAYPFFLLVFAHLAGYLLVPLAAGATEAAVGLSFYGAVLVAYVVPRARRHVLDARAA